MYSFGTVIWAVGRVCEDCTKTVVASPHTPAPYGDGERRRLPAPEALDFLGSVAGAGLIGFDYHQGIGKGVRVLV
jgi:hypothetical protein